MFWMIPFFNRFRMTKMSHRKSLHNGNSNIKKKKQRKRIDGIVPLWVKVYWKGVNCKVEISQRRFKVPWSPVTYNGMMHAMHAWGHLQWSLLKWRHTWGREEGSLIVRIRIGMIIKGKNKKVRFKPTDRKVHDHYCRIKSLDYRQPTKFVWKTFKVEKFASNQRPNQTSGPNFIEML